jgi:hypothetical protein
MSCGSRRAKLRIRLARRRSGQRAVALFARALTPSSAPKLPERQQAPVGKNRARRPPHRALRDFHFLDAALPKPVRAALTSGEIQTETLPRLWRPADRPQNPARSPPERCTLAQARRTGQAAAITVAHRRSPGRRLPRGRSPAPRGAYQCGRIFAYPLVSPAAGRFRHALAPRPKPADVQRYC